MNSQQLSVNKEEESPQEEESCVSETPSSLRDTPPLQGESLEIPKQDASATLCGRDARVPSASATVVSQKTQGVRPGRDNGMGVLQSAAKKAARSNSRSDVHEYMRLRRNYV